MSKEFVEFIENLSEKEKEQYQEYLENRKKRIDDYTKEEEKLVFEYVYKYKLGINKILNPIPYWKINPKFKALKKSDQWLLGHLIRIFWVLINSYSSIYLDDRENPIKKLWNLSMFGLTFLLPIALFEFYLYNSHLVFTLSKTVVSFTDLGYADESIYLLTFGFIQIAFVLGLALFFSFLYFLWKVLDLTIGQTIIGFSLVLWFSYLLIY